ncbi:MAG: PIN domain-containing protein [Deltaproteobacteria bacterium]|nr:PIN domain-containing protein [Deltaproteobacteria bacterium]
MTKVLVDADALVALAKSDDSNHKKALNILKRVNNPSFYISPYAIPEAVTVLSYHVSQSAAKTFLAKIREKKIRQLPLTTELERETDKIFERQNRKGISWFDCFNVALMTTCDLDCIFSFDKFYNKAGLQMLGQ